MRQTSGTAHRSELVDGKEPVAQQDQESVAGADGQYVVARVGEGRFIITRPEPQLLTGGLAEGSPKRTSEPSN